MKALLTPILLFVFAFPSCKDEGNDPPSPPPPSQPPPPADTARFEFRLDGLRKTYTLDDTIRGVLIAVNRGSPQPLYFTAPGFPPEYWSLRRIGREEHDFYYPIIIELTMYVDSLLLGDTLCFNISWAQESFAANVRSRTSDLQKAFAGGYQLQAHFPYSNLFGDIVRNHTLTITETGKALSSVLASMSFLNDTVDYGLAVRNRLSRIVEYAIDDSLPVKVLFSVGADTVLKRSYPLPFSVLSLQPFSDTMPFRFRRAERDTIFRGMRGTYKMKVSLMLRGLELSATKTVGIFP